MDVLGDPFMGLSDFGWWKKNSWKKLEDENLEDFLRIQVKWGEEKIQENR